MTWTRRRSPAAARAVVAGVLLAATAVACGGKSIPSPQSVLNGYLDDWSAQRWQAMDLAVFTPPPDFFTVNQQAWQDLGVTSATFSAGKMLVNAQTATAPVTEHLKLRNLGEWSPTTTFTLVKRNNRWMVSWTPQTINPSLTVGSRFAVTRTWAARAAILGAQSTSLAAPAGVVQVGIEGLRVKSSTQLTTVLQQAGAPKASIATALSQAAANPTYFIPVFQVTEARYAQLGGNSSELYRVPGTVFHHSNQRAALTPGLAAHIVGAVGPATAQELKALGPLYTGQTVVGQSGIEAAYERQLAGTPGGDVVVVNSAGKTTKVLHTVLPTPGKPVRTTISPKYQRAAESALAGVMRPAAFVAVKASTGAILASVSKPTTTDFDYALNGRFPPGSTFKIIDATALLNKGLTPTSPTACPPSLRVNGQMFHNAEGDGQAKTIVEAFAESCNTAFIALVLGNIPPDTLKSTAALYNLGTTPKIGLNAAAASVSLSAGKNGTAAAAIGQGELLTSPLNMAMVAAAVKSGTVRQPRLVVGAPDDTAPTHKLPQPVAQALEGMMASVVTSGTAAHTGLPAGTHAKTGTAEYGTGNPQPTDAWLVGYYGDVAFAMVEQGTGNGGPTDGPVVAKFLNSVGPGEPPG